jgi:hypothetical protein
MPLAVRPRLLALLALAAMTARAAPAAAEPVLGFREDFSAPGTSSWAGGAITENPGTGGYHGAGDGFLRVEVSGQPGKLGTNSFGTEYAGDWVAAGITQFRVWLRDVGEDEALNIHLGIGNRANFWQHDAGFAPPADRWAEYVVPLGSGVGWTRTIGSGEFQTALASADRVLIRHDQAPYVQEPDVIAGDFGVDRILLTNGLVGVGDHPLAVARPVELAAPYPNPSRGPVTFAFTQGEPGPVTFEVLDVTGRRVARVRLAEAPAGPRTWLWDGRGADGVRVPAGVYRVRASNAGGGTSRAVVRID